MPEPRPYTYLWVDIYRAGVHLFHDREACAAWLAGVYEHHAAQVVRCCAGMCHTFEDARGIAYHVLFIPKGAAHGTVAHECAHLALDLCETAGIHVREGQANEAFCYLLDLLVTKVTPLVKPRAMRIPADSQPAT